MFELNKDFLEGLEVPHMSETEERAFLAHLQEELETRVGERMSAGLSEAQVSEFEKIIDGVPEAIQPLLQSAGDYQNSAEYQRIKSTGNFSDTDDALLSEYASLLWLRQNYPQYEQTVREVIENLRTEIKSSSNKI